MKKYKLASAIVVVVLGILMLIGSISVLAGKESGIVQFFLVYGIGVVAVTMLVIGILQAIKKDLPVSKGFHITVGVLGILFQLIARFVGGYFMIMLSTAYAILLLIMEFVELKRQKGFAEKGLALLISIFAIVYASNYLVLSILGKFIPNNVENIIYVMCISILPALLVAKGVVDIVRSVKPAKENVLKQKQEQEVEQNKE